MTRGLMAMLLLLAGTVLSAEIKKSFYDDGKLKFERRYDNNGKLHGYSKGYYPTGALKIATRFYHGTQDGTTVGYYENGRIKAVLPYENGKISGKLEEFYSNGARRATEYYDANIPVRTKTVYYPNGNLKAKIHFDDHGRLHGTSKEYYADGNLRYNIKMDANRALKGHLYNRNGDRKKMTVNDFALMGLEMK